MAKEVDRQEVVRLMAEGAQLVEVLPREEYEEEHLAGAVSMPLKELAQGAAGLDSERALIVYCYDYQ